MHGTQGVRRFPLGVLPPRALRKGPGHAGTAATGRESVNHLSWDTQTNYTLLCDFYELTMGNGYFQNRNGPADLLLRRLLPGRTGRRRLLLSPQAWSRSSTIFRICAFLPRMWIFCPEGRLFRSVFAVSAAFFSSPVTFGRSPRHAHFSPEPIPHRPGSGHSSPV